MKKILLTGGGTAGHVIPNIALLPQLKAMGFEIHYAGSEAGIEKGIVEQAELPYHAISSGKLRRYLSMKNVTDAFRVLKGLSDANRLIKQLRPSVCFSKGGFVTVPIVIACWKNKVPVIIHESDMTLGLANKIAVKFASKICVTFPETMARVSKKKAVHTGTPIRKELFTGERQKGARLCNFPTEKPVVLVMGGSLGSVKINTCLRQALPAILEQFNVIHLCGKNNLDEQINLSGYKQFEYLSDEMPHVLAFADVIASRAGSNSINEFLALRKPALLIPLSKKASRGDQILNANSFNSHGFSAVMEEDSMTAETLSQAILNLYTNRGAYIAAMKKSPATDGVGQVLKVIENI